MIGSTFAVGSGAAATAISFSNDPTNNNSTNEVLSIYRNQASLGAIIANFGSSQQIDQLKILAGQKFSHTFGAALGDCQVGVNGASDNKIGTANTPNQFFQVYDGSGNMIIQTGNFGSEADIIFRDNNTESARFLNNGNFGIGTSVPITKLHISSSTITIDGTGSPTNSQALCLLGGQLGHCTSAVGAGGGCTCSVP